MSGKQKIFAFYSCAYAICLLPFPVNMEELDVTFASIDSIVLDVISQKKGVLRFYVVLIISSNSTQFLAIF